MEMSETLISAEEFANTYSPKGSPSGWATVEAYREWQRWQSKHPDAGRTAAGNALEMPASRIRVWQDGGKPDPVRGLTVAKERGWIEVETDTAVAEGLIRLLAWIYSSGSLPQLAESATTPRFSVRGEQEERRLERIATAANVELRYDRERKHRGTEAIPSSAGRELGRVFLVLGAQRGSKTDELQRLPATVTQRAVGSVGEWFVATYLRNRCSLNVERDRWVQFREERSESYLASLRQLIETVLETETAGRGENIRLEADKVRTFLQHVDNVDGPELEW